MLRGIAPAGVREIRCRGTEAFCIRTPSPERPVLIRVSQGCDNHLHRYFRCQRRRKLGHGAAQNWATLDLRGTRAVGGGQSAALSM